MPYQYILAIFFLLNPDQPPQLLAPAADKAACFKMAGEFAVKFKTELEADKAAPICLKIELPTV